MKALKLTPTNAPNNSASAWFLRCDEVCCINMTVRHSGRLVILDFVFVCTWGSKHDHAGGIPNEDVDISISKRNLMTTRFTVQRTDRSTSDFTAAGEFGGGRIVCPDEC